MSCFIVVADSIDSLDPDDPLTLDDLVEIFQRYPRECKNKQEKEKRAEDAKHFFNFYWARFYTELIYLSDDKKVLVEGSETEDGENHKQLVLQSDLEFNNGSHSKKEWLEFHQAAIKRHQDSLFLL